MGYREEYEGWLKRFANDAETVQELCRCLKFTKK